MLPALAQEGVVPVVGVLRGPFDLQGELEERGLRVVHLPRVGKWNLVAAHCALAALCRREHVALVHAHLYFPSLYAAACRLGGGPPMVETFHNLAYAGANAGGWKLAVRRHLRSRLLRRAATRTYGVSAAVAEHYAEAMGLAHVAVLPNVIDFVAIDAAQPAARDENVLRIVVPGRLVREKGHADLLAALAVGGLPSFDLRFVGEGPLRSALADEARIRGIALTITGSLAHYAFLSEVAAADIVITPSHHEGFGIAAAEAMALGKPVIASDAGGLPEVVGDAGLLFPAGDIITLSTALRRVIADRELRASLGRAAMVRARDAFAPEKVAAQLAADYREIVAEDFQRAGE
jgi:glycosyltransferase involved in cell wall biosynthesis